MLFRSTEIQTGFLYYYGIKRRIAVDITEERKEAVRNTFEKMHRLFERGYTPKGKPSAKCTSCSLKEICLPVLCKKKSAASYMKQIEELSEIIPRTKNNISDILIKKDILVEQ